jgi:hypothetical protein
MGCMACWYIPDRAVYLLGVEVSWLIRNGGRTAPFPLAEACSVAEPALTAVAALSPSRLGHNEAPKPYFVLGPQDTCKQSMCESEGNHHLFSPNHVHKRVCQPLQ